MQEYDDSAQKFVTSGFASGSAIYGRGDQPRRVTVSSTGERRSAVTSSVLRDRHAYVGVQSSIGMRFPANAAGARHSTTRVGEAPVDTTDLEIIFES
jgi:hypothetical protein